MASYPLITNISLFNFRAFKKEKRIALRPLTFLVGPNSGGKSSVLSAIGLLGQSMIHPGDPFNSEVTWSGSLVDLGSFTDAVHRHKTNLTMKVGVEIANFQSHLRRGEVQKGPQPPISITVCISNGGSDKPGIVSQVIVADSASEQQVKITPVRRKSNPHIRIECLGKSENVTANLEDRFRSGESTALKIREIVRTKKKQLSGKLAGWRRIANFVDGFSYFHVLPGTERVSSGRAGPKRWYAAGSARDRIFHFFGEPTRFENVDPVMIAASQQLESPSKRVRRKKPPISLDATLKRLNIASSIRPERLGPYHTGIHVKDNMTNVKSNLIDVGYGASQVIPVLRACQSRTTSPLCIEQPEIHLHPKAQGDVAEVLCDTSQHRQVLVETHSVHMINRARLRIARGELKSSDVMIIYVDRDKDGSHVHEIPITENGDFAVDWPEGFFEERYSDTLELMKLQQERQK
jgi:AAA15 family ATPase/GTPase